MAMSVDMSNYESAHQVNVNWNSADYGAQPANWYAWRIKVTNLEDSTVRIIDTPTWAGAHQVIDRFAVSNQSLSYDLYKVTADTNGQYETHVDVQVVTTSADDYWLIHPTDASRTVRLWHVTADAYTSEHEDNELKLIGRGRKIDTGESWGVNGSLTAQLRNRTGATARDQRKALQQLKEDRVAITMQTPFGDTWQVFLKDLQIARVGGVGVNEFVDVTVPYEEVR